MQCTCCVASSSWLLEHIFNCYFYVCLTKAMLQVLPTIYNIIERILSLRSADMEY